MLHCLCDQNSAPSPPHAQIPSVGEVLRAETGCILEVDEIRDTLDGCSARLTLTLLAVPGVTPAKT